MINENPFYESIDITDYIYNNNIIIPLLPNEHFISMIPIPGIIDIKPDLYFISNYGRILSKVKTKDKYTLLAGTLDTNGYIIVKLCNNNSMSSNYRVHRLVKIYFDFNIDCKYLIVDHLNGNRRDNYLENLRWTDQKGNHETAINNNLNYLKFDKSDIINIKKKIYYGESLYSIASEYGVSEPMISLIKNGHAYNHIHTPYDEVIISTKKTLTKEQIFEIYNKSANKIDDQKYAEEYGVSIDTIKNIRTCSKYYGQIMPNNTPLYLPSIDKRRFSEDEAINIYNRCKTESVNSIAKEFMVDITVINDIKFTRGGYKYLYEKYNLNPQKNLREHVSEEIAIEVHKALVTDTTRNVAKKFGICEKTVYLIKFCLPNFEFLKTKYGLEPYSKLRGGNINA